MNDQSPWRYRFGRFDRITIARSHYRVVESPMRTIAGDEDVTPRRHKLQLVVDGIPADTFIELTDDVLREHYDRNAITVDPAYFSEANTDFRARHDDTSMLTLTDKQLRTIDWKTEWCRRFNDARIRKDYPIPIKMTQESLRAFIELERDAVARWYRRKYKENRPLGRRIVPEVSADRQAPIDKEHKAFDYPSPSTLWNWLKLFEKEGYHSHAFRPRYYRCGRGRQLPPELEVALTDCVDEYKSWLRPAKNDIYEKVETRIDELERRYPGREFSVSRQTVYNRINALDPFEVELGREGEDRARRKYTMVGKGNGATRALERVEMDDWEADLFTLITKSSVYKRLTPEQRKKIPRVRSTISVAIDCATRIIVGLHVSPDAPSTYGTKRCIRSICENKQNLAEWAEAKCRWDMQGRPELLVTDAGPVMRNFEIQRALDQSGINTKLPPQDPRKRGTIEAFFRTLKRLCRRYAGQAFETVVKRGDYPAEEMASLTHEEFYKRVVKFVVDDYHNHSHRGLEGLSPIARWDWSVGETPPAPPVDRTTLRYAHGFVLAAPLTLDRQGVIVFGIPYVSQALGYVLRHVGSKTKFTVVVDPEDLSSVFVVLDEKLRPLAAKAEDAVMVGDALMVGTRADITVNRTLAQQLQAQKAVKDIVAADRQAGKVFRVAANAELFEDGLRKMRELGLPTHTLTQAMIDRIEKAMARVGRAGVSDVNYADEPRGDDETEDDVEAARGTPVGRVKRTRPRRGANTETETPNEPDNDTPSAAPDRPFSRNINFGEEDDE